MITRKILVAPSVLGADLSKLAEEIKSVEQSGADWIHVDVMDGRFVPPISFGEIMVQHLRRITHLPLDTHLMIVEAEKHLEDFKKAGSDIITIHVEASSDVRNTLRAIRANGMKSGLSLKPSTPIQSIFPFLDECDLVLVMSVEPGWGGQKFNQDAPNRIQALRNEIDKLKLKTLIQVDGGLTNETSPLCIKAGVDCIVSGTFIFCHFDKGTAIASLKGN
ncbi:MAG: ribulose-phosphate 3-epimerase [SAR324 cluster bacterium]|uniref:Ribulose-phosphate 3-epimerase n=1 Tax=SAR324 cluster bacterium TaxID=2024889 RepID=A0A7X9FRI6_9DELT|nr:ribulose-phosphate 3-epimerase [SAR324 cluster bacterium]